MERSDDDGETGDGAWAQAYEQEWNEVANRLGLTGDAER